MRERNEYLESLYREMMRIRMVEETIADRYTEWEMRCPVHLSIGQEAAAVAICAHLETSDLISSNHRSHAHYLAKGGSLPAMIAELYGKADGCAGGRGGSMHLFDQDAGVLPCVPIVGDSIPLGVGAALTFQQTGASSISAVFFGDGAVEEGIFYESANFAALRKLPVIFACENNLYSVCTHVDSRQPNRPLTDLAAAHAIPTAHVDGNDVMAIYDAMAEAAHRARHGGGPSFLLMDTYRTREHCGPFHDIELGYRSQEEFDSWSEQCPLKRHRVLMEAELGWTDAEEESLLASIRTEIDAAFDYAIESKFPEHSTAGNHVYA